MIALPSRPDRDLLMGFWLALCLGIAAAAAAMGALAGLPHPLAIGAAAALIGGGLGMLRPGIVSPLYALWNRAARAYARRARRAILAVYYYMAFAAGRLAGSSVRLRGPGDGASGWVPRRSLAPEEYPGQAPAAGASGEGWWPVVLVRWSVRSGRPWVIALLPLFVLLRALEAKETEAVHSNIYTLY